LRRRGGPAPKLSASASRRARRAMVLIRGQETLRRRDRRNGNRGSRNRAVVRARRLRVSRSTIFWSGPEMRYSEGRSVRQPQNVCPRCGGVFASGERMRFSRRHCVERRRRGAALSPEPRRAGVLQPKRLGMRIGLIAMHYSSALRGPSGRWGRPLPRTKSRWEGCLALNFCVGRGLSCCFPVSAGRLKSRRHRTESLRPAMPYSGPCRRSARSARGMLAISDWVNERGVITPQGQLIRSTTAMPAGTVEQTRRLVESVRGPAVFSSIGTAHNTAIAKYLQGRTSLSVLPCLRRVRNFATSPNFPQATSRPCRRCRYEARLYELAEKSNAKSP